jgi:hypothetical protein
VLALKNSSLMGTVPRRIRGVSGLQVRWTYS